MHRARVAFTIPEDDLFPEGLAFDPDRRVFYMGSMYRRKIIAITEAGDVSDFVKPELYGLKPVGGIKVDPSDRSVWAATDGPEFVHFDARGTLLERFATEEAGPHILNDLVLRGRREVYLTDTSGNRVYRFDRELHRFTAMTLHRPLFAPNGIALSPDEHLLYVGDNLGVIVVDLRNGVARDVRPGRGNTLAGVDGLYWYRGSLLAVQYGTGAFRVVRWRLSIDGRRVTSTEILESGTSLITFPTTGAVAGGNFYFIANTGIGNLKNGEIADRKKLEPVHVAVVPLDRG